MANFAIVLNPQTKRKKQTVEQKTYYKRLEDKLFGVGKSAKFIKRSPNDKSDGRIVPEQGATYFSLIATTRLCRAYQPNREKFKGSDPFSFLPYWGFVIGHKPIEKL
ncbi:hypothetical protein [Bacteroides faecichinchillae]|uniref:hypothetical protein n=1 Tax=Bacteroides faecichinchillae TaxID=871325 RepID=UPI0010A6512F|nr:hypothetical protein [Bacteroides faecichinchillae]THG68495.1 hypothetical protein E5981_04960 [Bacteroides faecichinchillae]